MPEEPKSSWASDLDEPYAVDLSDVVSELDKLHSRVGDIADELQKLDQMVNVLDAIGHIQNESRSTLLAIQFRVSVFFLLIIAGIVAILGTLRHWF